MARHKQPAPSDGRDTQNLPAEQAEGQVVPDYSLQLEKHVEPSFTVPPAQAGKSAKQAVAPNDYSDWVFGGSFVAAAVFGVANAINHIRHNFYESFVKPSSDVLDLKKTTNTEASAMHPFADLFRARKTAYQELSQKFSDGQISGVDFAKQKIEATIAHDKKVDAFSREKFGIATKGPRSWALDVWKQRNHTGTFARRHAAFTMATTTVLGVAAISTLKYTKHLLDRIDDNEKQQQDFFDQTKALRAGRKDHFHTANVNDNVPGNRVVNVEQVERLAPAELARS